MGLAIIDRIARHDYKLPASTWLTPQILPDASSRMPMVL